MCWYETTRSVTLIVPSVKLSTIDSRAFPSASSCIWNTLPENVVSHFSITWKAFCSSAHSRTLYCSGPSNSDDYFGLFKNDDWLIDWLTTYMFVLLRLLLANISHHLLVPPAARDWVEPWRRRGGPVCWSTPDDDRRASCRADRTAESGWGAVLVDSRDCALTLVVGRQEGHSRCKKLGVCWWCRFDWSYARLIAPVITTTSIILSFNNIG